MMGKLLPTIKQAVSFTKGWLAIAAMAALSACSTTYPVYVDSDYEPPARQPAGENQQGDFDDPAYGEPYPDADSPPVTDESEGSGLPDWALLDPEDRPSQSNNTVDSTNPAVKSLLSTALEQRRLGDFPAAFATLERALRISPREAKVYYAMAQVRFEEKQLAQAEQFARKAVSLASSDRRTKGDAWSLIASVRAEKGDWDGEQAARDKARALR